MDVSKYARYAPSLSVHAPDHSERRRACLSGVEGTSKGDPEHYYAQETAAGEREAEAACLEGPGQPLRVSIGNGAH